MLAAIMSDFDFSPVQLAALAQSDARRALSEDVGGGDLTAALIDPARTRAAPVCWRARPR